MNKIFEKYRSLSKMTRDTLKYAISFVNFCFAVISVMGYSLDSLKKFKICAYLLADNGNLKIGWKILLLLIFYLIVFLGLRLTLCKIYKNSIEINIGKNTVVIKCGDIFKVPGYKVIPCDSQFNLKIDDVVISKNSLHGQLVLKHGVKKEIENEIKNRAESIANIQKGKNELYEFQLGTVIRYRNTKEDTVYLMLAMTTLNENYEAHTTRDEFEQTLVKMWKEIDRVYASNDIILPILGAGISRFDDGSKDTKSLLGSMLWTLKTSGVTFNCKINIVIYGENNISLYEYKDSIYNI